MFVPIYHRPADPASAPVLAAERAILAAEGPHHVAGRYVADTRLAADLRRAEAARRVVAAYRFAALDQTAPPVCDGGCSDAVEMHDSARKVA